MTMIITIMITGMRMTTAMTIHIAMRTTTKRTRRTHRESALRRF